MITSVAIESFRGVREGGVEGLAPISILVGPNNTGKSTVLEAIALVGWEHRPEQVAALLLRRGGPPLDAFDHVVHHGAGEAKLRISTGNGGSSTWLMTLDTRRERGPAAILSTKVARAEEPERGAQQIVVNEGSLQNVTHNPLAAEAFPVSFIDVDAIRAGDALEDAHSRIGRAGQLDLVVHALQRAMPGLTGLQIFKSDSRFILHTLLGKARAVPAYLAGDGFKRFLAMAAAVLDVPREGVVLLEEPESFQHPRYLEELARLLHLAAREGTQIILSTHSLELIDLLLRAPEAEGQAYPAVHRLRLHEGKLRATTIPRDNALLGRDSLLEDLRA